MLHLMAAYGILLAQDLPRPVISAPTQITVLPSIGDGMSSEGAIQFVISAVISAVFTLSATLAVAGVMYGGFLMIRGGDSIEKGKKAIMWSLLGLLVMAMSYSIVRIVTSIDPNAEDMGTGSKDAIIEDAPTDETPAE